jgi:hypothetical protein
LELLAHERVDRTIAGAAPGVAALDEDEGVRRATCDVR